MLRQHAYRLLLTFSLAESFTTHLFDTELFNLTTFWPFSMFLVDDSTLLVVLDLKLFGLLFEKTKVVEICSSLKYL